MIYIIIVYLLLNVFLPILFRSIERTYQFQIDWLVKGLVAATGRTFVSMLQWLLAVFFIPAIAIGLLLHLFCPKVAKRIPGLMPFLIIIMKGPLGEKLIEELKKPPKMNKEEEK